jgi:UDP:flavonoid glycosyltransferase YjiC (YdhE family)
MNAQPSRNALFVSIPMLGHLSPLLIQGAELARRGWRVRVASLEDARKHVEGKYQGVEFFSLAPADGGSPPLAEIEAHATQEPDFLKGSIAMMKWTHRLWPAMYDGVQRAIRECPPDVIVSDFSSMAGVDAAQQAAVPLVANNPFVLPVIPIGTLPPPFTAWAFASGCSIRPFAGWRRAS